eukprot:g12751.t1
MAVASRDGVDVVTNEVSGRQTPSAVYFAGNHRLIGEHTTGHAGGNPTNLVHHLKSMLGGEGGPGGEESGQVDGDEPLGSSSSSSSSRDSGSSSTAAAAAAAAAAEPSFFCETRREDQGLSSGQSAGLRAVVRHMGQPLELGASEVVSYLLRHCAGIAEREAAGREAGAPSSSSSSSSSPPSSCVVASVPSFFTLRQKRAVLDAASIAGVAMPMVINEGTAVALAYGILKGGRLPPAAVGSSARPPLKVAFVDIGHSCTQVTVASFTASGLRVLGRGCARGGGTAAAEACVYDRVCRDASEDGIVVKGRPRAEFRLAKALTSAMKTLSANKEARLSVDCIDGDRDLAVTLTREEVEEACAGVAEGVLVACREALRSAGLAAKDIQDVELLGGGSYIPLLRRSVESTFGDRVRRTMSSSESVARGCALAAAQHSSVFKLRPFRVVDSLSKGLRLVWRYDGGGTGKTRGSSSSSPSRTGNGAGDEGGDERGGTTTTGEVDLAAGTSIPWSTPVVVDLGARRTAAGAGAQAKGQERSPGRVHVHLMEGADRVASYLIDLAPAPTGGVAPGARRAGAGFFGGWGAGAGAGAGGSSPSDAAERGAPSKLKFFFRVDDGGVPSVQSASLEYEEEVTEFVEVPAPAPPPTPAAVAAAGSSPSSTSVDDGQGRGAAAQRTWRQRSSEGGAEGAGDAEPEEGTKGEGEEGKRDSSDDAAKADSIAGKDGAAETADASEAPGGGGPGQAVEEGEQGTKGEGEGVKENGRRKPPARAPEAKKIKVPRVVTRMRSRPVRLKQTYTGMLEGAALEEARARERSLRAQDESVRSANEARNALENLLYATRSSLEPFDGDLSAFISPGDAAAVLAFLEETEKWLYAPEEEENNTPDKETFERRASSLHQRLAEPRARREARAALAAALDDAEAAVVAGQAQLEEARASLSESQRRHGDNELASIQRFVEETRKKLEASARSSRGHENGGCDYGSSVGSLPLQEGDVHKKVDHLRKVLAFARKEHS